MAGRGRPGRAPQVEKREQFARLIAQGFSNPEASRIVGINRQTGKRWRHGRTITARDGRRLHYPAVVTTGAVRREISPRYLPEDERVQIADLRQAGAGVRAIAERLGRSARPGVGCSRRAARPMNQVLTPRRRRADLPQ
jgi:transposase, IS30 family